MENLWRSFTRQKKRFFPPAKGVKKRFADQMDSVVMATFTIGRIQNGFDNAERHTGPQDAKRIP